MARRYDSRTTIFSPEGRLYQVEYAMEAIGNAGAAVGILAKDGVVLAAEKRITSKVRAPCCAQDASHAQNELWGPLRATSKRAHPLALHFPGQQNAAPVSYLASATLLHARCMLQLPVSAARDAASPCFSTSWRHRPWGPCECPSIVLTHAPHCVSQAAAVARHVGCGGKEREDVQAG